MTDQQYATILLAIYSSHFLGRGWNMLVAGIQIATLAVYWWKG